MLSRISSVVDPLKIDYIISNHAEMDHSGCLPDMMELIKPEKVLASSMGVKALTDHFQLSQNVEVVKDGETRTFGNFTFTFFETKMLHWPDSMFTYFADDKILFSQD